MKVNFLKHNAVDLMQVVMYCGKSVVSIQKMAMLFQPSVKQFGPVLDITIATSQTARTFAIMNLRELFLMIMATTSDIAINEWTNM